MTCKMGDRITFRAVTRWNNGQKVTRKVTGFDQLSGRPTVRYGGWGNFIVRTDEIVSVEQG